MKLRIEDGWAIVEACGLTLKFPATDDTMSDDRVEITCGGSRVFVERHDNGPLVSAIEHVSQ